MALGQALAFGATQIRVCRGSSGGLTQIPKLGNRPRPRRRARPSIYWLLRREKSRSSWHNYFVPFV